MLAGPRASQTRRWGALETSVGATSTVRVISLRFCKEKEHGRGGRPGKQEQSGNG
jgi:hypothetical protein